MTRLSLSDAGSTDVSPSASTAFHSNVSVVTFRRLALQIRGNKPSVVVCEDVGTDKGGGTPPPPRRSSLRITGGPGQSSVTAPVCPHHRSLMCAAVIVFTSALNPSSITLILVCYFTFPDQRCSYRVRMGGGFPLRGIIFSQPDFLKNLRKMQIQELAPLI